ncbi:MAG TPA: S41 family peptidase [Bacteroidota bacterium]
MQAKTKIVIAIAAFVFVLFMVTLSGNFLFEELIVLYLIPFAPVGSILILSLLVARIRKRSVLLERRGRRLLIAGSIFHCLFIAVFLFCTWPRYYDRAEAVEDIDYFVKTLEDVHPNLYDRVSRKVFADSVENLKRRIPGSLGENELFVDISRLGALVQDGHTGNGYSYFMRRGNLLFRRVFPYKIKVENERIYVTGNYSYKDEIPAGSEIVRINGLTEAEFISQLSALLSFETVPFRNTLLANPMFIAIWNDFKEYVVEYRLSQSSELQSITASGGIYARIQFIRSLTALRQPYEFRVVADSIGYIGFYQCSDLERFKGFLKETFETVKNKRMSHLIIDVRRNGGGNSALGDEFMQYVSRKQFRTFDRVTIKVSKEILSLYPDWTDLSKREPGSLYEIPDIPLTPLRENPLRFDGDCTLLTSRHTFSSASAFASAFRCFDVGVIVGAETGGITVCYGDVYGFTLPHTKFGFGVSHKEFTNACGVDDRRGVIPDYFVESSFSEERKGEDTVLEFAVELARKTGVRRGPPMF